MDGAQLPSSGFPSQLTGATHLRAMTLEGSAASKEGRFLGAAHDEVEILTPVTPQAEGGHVIHVLGIRSADNVSHLTLAQRRQPLFDGNAAWLQVHFGLGAHFRVVTALVEPQILPASHNNNNNNINHNNINNNIINNNIINKNGDIEYSGRLTWSQGCVGAWSAI